MQGSGMASPPASPLVAHVTSPQWVQPTWESASPTLPAPPCAWGEGTIWPHGRQGPVGCQAFFARAAPSVWHEQMDSMGPPGTHAYFVPPMVSTPYVPRIPDPVKDAKAASQALKPFDPINSTSAPSTPMSPGVTRAWPGSPK
mmetsp:Transcript_77367/g.136452  ORF Transcript_77367/g.136452 Transcript_77367/m.136452 type:complete len:143 (-) Transcript_77367:1499-1927(-)